MKVNYKIRTWLRIKYRFLIKMKNLKLTNKRSSKIKMAKFTSQWLLQVINSNHLTWDPEPIQYAL